VNIQPNTRARNPLPARPWRQFGVTLIEVLIAVLVLAIGLLGMTALQVRTLQNNQSSAMRNQAVVLTYFMLDAMRANRQAALAGSYVLPKTCDPPDPGTLVANDQRAWIEAIKNNLGNNAEACGQIAIDGGTHTVTVFWNDARATDGQPQQSVATSTRL
jgi:type IV pilus assembly protein PilV